MTTSTREDTPPAFWEGVLVSPLSFFLSFALSLPRPRPNFPLSSCLFVYLSVVCSIRGLFRCSSRSFFLSFVRSFCLSFFLSCVISFFSPFFSPWWSLIAPTRVYFQSLSQYNLWPGVKPWRAAVWSERERAGDDMTHAQITLSSELMQRRTFCFFQFAFLNKKTMAMRPTCLTDSLIRAIDFWPWANVWPRGMYCAITDCCLRKIFSVGISCIESGPVALGSTSQPSKS